MLEDDGQDAFYQGMDAFDDGSAGLDNPYHPSLEREKYLDWAEGWAYGHECAWPAGSLSGGLQCSLEATQRPPAQPPQETPGHG